MSVSIDEMSALAPDMDGYLWPPVDGEAIDVSLCYHARRFVESCSHLDVTFYDKIGSIVNTLERIYSCTKVSYNGWPSDFGKFIRDSVDWNSSPGWPWKRSYPTNRDLFGFDGVAVLPERVAMVEAAVYQRWMDLTSRPVADPIHLFIKQEPHKKSKAEKLSWRLISGVGLTDSLVDRLLYGNWLDKLIESWPEIPSKAGWAPQLGGFKWLSKAFRGKTPVSIDKSSWDWTVNSWHVNVIKRLVPRMIFGRGDGWDSVFENRILALYGAGHPIFKPSCGCEFVQLVDGIQKSGMLATIGFNSIWQVAVHLAAGGTEDQLLFSLGDDTVQEKPRDLTGYVEKLSKVGALVKEVDVGWPIVFGGHKITEDVCLPAYRGKHMFALSYLDEKVGFETLESYRHLYALDDEVSPFLEQLVIRKYGVKNVLSREYLRDWYLAME